MNHNKSTTSPFEAIWKAEIIRQQEAAQGPFAIHHIKSDVDSESNFQQRAIQRAARLIERQQLMPKLQRYQLLWRVVIWAILLTAAISGFSIAVQLTPTHLRTVSLIEALLMLIGINALFIGVWLISVLAKPRARGLAGWVMQLVTNRLHNPDAVLVATAHSSVMRRYALVKPTFSSLSHLFWVVLLSSAMLTLIARFIAFEYEFVWRTTLLSQQQIETALTWLHIAPQQLGFARPDILELGRSGQENRDIALWLLLCIGVYALVPRLLLFIGSESIRRGRLKNFPLDWSLAGWSELQQQWQQGEHTQVDSAPAIIERRGPRNTLPQATASPVLLKDHLAITIDWPAPEHSQLISNLQSSTSLLITSANSASERQHMLTALAESSKPPPVLVLVNPQVSPDRGTLRFLDALHSYARIQIGLVNHSAADKQAIWLDYLKTHLVETPLLTLSDDAQHESLAQGATEIAVQWLANHEETTL